MTTPFSSLPPLTLERWPNAWKLYFTQRWECTGLVLLTGHISSLGTVPIPFISKEWRLVAELHRRCWAEQSLLLGHKPAVPSDHSGPSLSHAVTHQSSAHPTENHKCRSSILNHLHTGVRPLLLNALGLKLPRQLSAQSNRLAGPG